MSFILKRAFILFALLFALSACTIGKEKPDTISGPVPQIGESASLIANTNNGAQKESSTWTRK